MISASGVTGSVVIECLLAGIYASEISDPVQLQLTSEF
jgi:hypothetical protein